MAEIGIDFTGQLGYDPPVTALATRTSRKKVQKYHAVRISKQEHGRLVGCTSNWREKVGAIMIFMTARILLNPGDVIIVDMEFEGRRRELVSSYLRRLIGFHFFGDHPRNATHIKFLPKEFSSAVRDADAKCTLTREKKLKVHVTDPNLTKDIELLS